MNKHHGNLAREGTCMNIRFLHTGSIKALKERVIDNCVAVGRMVREIRKNRRGKMSSDPSVLFMMSLCQSHRAVFTDTCVGERRFG
jgi:hypothetical protein